MSGIQPPWGGEHEPARPRGLDGLDDGLAVDEIVARWEPLAVEQGDRSGIASSVLLAMIVVESSGRRYAYNPEPPYRYLWDVRRQCPFRALTAAEIVSEYPPADFPAPSGVDRDAEWWGQQASWGLMQIMGAVARERGYRGTDLPEICEPELNVRLGTEHLSWLLRRDGLIWNAVGRYNGGPGFVNPVYVAKVRAALARVEGLSDP